MQRALSLGGSPTPTEEEEMFSGMNEMDCDSRSRSPYQEEDGHYSPQLDSDTNVCDDNGQEGQVEDVDKESPVSCARSPLSYPSGNSHSLTVKGDSIIQDFSRHRMMRNETLSPETSKLLREILQGKERMQQKLANGSLVDPSFKGNESLITKLLHRDRGMFRNGGLDEIEGSMPSCSPGEISSDESDQENNMKMANGVSNSTSTIKHTGDYNENTEHPNEEGTGSKDEVQAKKARVENIISTMARCTGGPNGEMSQAEQRRQKRKQNSPQQHDSRGTDHSAAKYRKTEEKDVLKKQLKEMQDQLLAMQQRYLQLFEVENSAPQGEGPEGEEGKRKSGVGGQGERREEKKNSGLTLETEIDPSQLITEASKLVKEQELVTKHAQIALNNSARDIHNLANTLKLELNSTVSSVVDNIMAKFVRQQKKNNLSPPLRNMAASTGTEMTDASQQTVQHQHQHQQQKEQNQEHQPNDLPHRASPPKPIRTKVTDKQLPIVESPNRQMCDLQRPHFTPPFPHHPFYGLPSPLTHHGHNPYKQPEQTEPMPLVVTTPKKKRTKVTDTRLSPRAARALLTDNNQMHQPHHPLLHPHHPQHPHHEHPDQPPHHHQQPHHHPHHPHPHHLQHHDPYGHPLLPVALPTSVAIPNPSLQHSDVLAMYTHGSEHPAFHNEGTHSSSHSPTTGDRGSPGMGPHTPQDSLAMSMMKNEHDMDHHSDSPMGFDGSGHHQISFFSRYNEQNSSFD